MADKKDNRLLEEITPRDVDFAQWYTDIVKKAELADYSGIKGCMVVRPYGCALWENIHNALDARFKELGHENVMMPMFIPESLLNKEKDHVEGFAPEVAWVTRGGSEELQEPICVRPTSETLFCDHYSRTVQSYRDLPKLYNQWCSVVRWEKTTRPFLRTTEFFWQEGHTIHETPEEAMEETLRMLDVYADFCRDRLAIPVLKGQKTDKEKFAGAVSTFTIEAMMHDGKALQSGTSHYFGDGFSRAFDVTFADRNNKLAYPHQTSWGMSTRIIGAIIMVHGDDRGLVLPPMIAPVQVAIVPVASHKEGVLDAARALAAKLKAAGIRVTVDEREASPGWKFAEHEMRGVPLRIEIGPRDIENGVCMAAKRNGGDKFTIANDDSLAESVKKVLADVQSELYAAALENLNSHIYEATDLETFKDIAENKPGFIKAMLCENHAHECEDKLKEVAGVTSRCIPFEGEPIADTCIVCGKKAKNLVYFGKAY